MRDCGHGTSYTSAILSRQDLPPDLRRRFRTGRACLDLTHTGGEGDYARWELLHEARDISQYLALILGVEALRADRSDFEPVRDLRTAITSAAHSAVRGDRPTASAIDSINRAAAHSPLTPRLSRDRSAELLPGTTRQALSTLARDAIDLFSSPLADRIRVCAADDCGLLFVDASRPGQRRWCSMERCGDRAKKRKARAATSPA